MHDRLMDAYWTEARNIGDADELRALATEVGIDDPEAAWDDPTYLERVLASTAQAHSIGVTGVPGFLLDRRLLVLGAQPRELFARAFEQLHAGELPRRRPSMLAAVSGLLSRLQRRERGRLGLVLCGDEKCGLPRASGLLEPGRERG